MTSSTGTVVFNDAKLQAIDVVATERLGVGTLDPTSNLHVVGNVHVTGNVNKLNFTDGYTIKRGANVTVFGTTDVIQEITGPHARHVVPLRKYPEVLLTSNVQGGYVASASNASDTRPPWHAFDGDVVTAWGTNGGAFSTGTPGSVASSGSYPGEIITLADGTSHDRGHWLKLNLPNKIKIYNYKLRSGSTDRRPASISLLGSNDDTNWYIIKDVHSVGATDEYTVSVNSPSAYGYIMLLVHSIVGSDNQMKIDNLEYYGYEETSDPDTSVDTKITSQFNLPDTTGVKLYIDGDKGSTATDFSGEGHTLTENNAAYDSTEKAWEFSSLATSNVTMTSGDLAMEGTHPHSVSLWFNAANVSSNATLFHVGTAAGEGDAKTSISLTESGHLGWIDGGDNQFLSANTWHNLVYATQGGGGVRTCYLDGRKLGDAQVQDTFGEYPPFAMSSYSQGGYVVSTGDPEHDGGQYIWKAFDGDVSTFWFSHPGSADADSTYLNGDPRGNAGQSITDSNGTTHTGSWGKIEFPHKFVLNYLEVQGGTPASAYYPHNPNNYVILGSNDDEVWDLLSTRTGASPTSDGMTTGGTQIDRHTVNAQKAYKYIIFLVTQINTLGGGREFIIAALRLYGHRENDLVRFPDSVNTLKYPHVAMTGPAQRGYVATASSYRTVGPGDYRPHKAFNKVFNAGSNQGWNNQNTLTEYNGTDYLYNGSINLGTGAQNGEWIKLELPRKILMTSMTLYSRDNDPTRAPEDFIVYGSNDDSNWSELLSEVGATPADTGTTYTADTATTYYKYFALVVRRITGQNNYFSIDNIEYIGTEEDLDVVARVGEGLDGKVANFRVYDKYLHEEQALELWDSQKDQFGRAESSVVVHKGRLGVGTTEPEGRFAVLDEAHAPEEFPPRAMTATENYMEGHGVFRVSASSIVTGTNATENVFDKKSLGSNASFWLVGNGAGYNTTDGSYEGESGVIYQLSPETPTGQYITLEMPYRIKLEKYLFMPRYNTNYQTPKDWELWGSNDGNTWTKLHNVVGNTEYLKSVTYDSPQTNFYRYFGFIVTRTIMTGAPSGYDYMAISELKFFGTREQGQSTLHDGQLTLTKNLTVPRIGPALDADDTPRRDSLVVEYNTSTNPTANGTVKDTSGRGLDGLIYNGASYDAAEKALVFDGTDDYVSMSDWKYNTGFIHSFSGWIKFKSPEESWNVVYGVGDAAGTSRTNFTIWTRTNNSHFRTEADGSGSFVDHTFEFTGNMDKWLHMAVVKSSARIDSTRIYINGVLLPQTNATLADRDIALPNTPQNFNLSSYGPSAVSTGNVNLSNVKFYDVALTADEVKRLYDMGRCDEGHHVVNFSKTRVGIGLGDGEAPRKQLDIRGSGLCTNRVVVGGGGKETLDLPGVAGGEIHVHQRGYAVGSTVTDSANMANTAITMHAEGASGNPWSIGVGDGYRLCFIINTNVKGYIANTGGPVQANFTGQHRTFIRDVPFTSAGELEGLIVSADNNKYIKMSGGIAAGSNAITTNESLPVVSLSSEACDKKCFGVISDAEDPENRVDEFGSFVTAFSKEKGDTRVHINSVGEGAIWVVNANGSLESGDYITTSNVAGYGQKQESDSLKNYTVAKITMDCDFNPQDQPIQRIKQSNVVETHYTGLVPVVKGVPHEFVTTTVTTDDEWSNVSVSPSDVTYAEWSNLEANVQNTYTLTYTQTSNVVYDVKYTKTTTANVTAEDAWDAVHIEPPSVTYAEYSNLEANVQNTYSLTYTMTTKVEATEAIYSNLSTEDKEFFVPTYYQLVEQTVDAEYPGAVKHETVTDRLENALDEHGQLQWEDDPSGVTEKAYKIRYLDATGQQTDEANCVHRAAFVGCTYHCG
jgi:hypothetical protein